jgi:hypothetical protein
MDWSKRHSQSFASELDTLEFEARKARVYRVDIDASLPPRNVDGKLSSTVLTTEAEVFDWITKHSFPAQVCNKDLVNCFSC